MADDVEWVEVRSGADRLRFFSTSPYLNKSSTLKHGRLAYSTSPPFGDSSIAKVGKHERWFKVIHRMDGDRRTAVSVDTMLAVAATHGFKEGTGLHRNLVEIPVEQISDCIGAPRALTLFPAGNEIIADVAAHYQVDPMEVRLTGAASAIGERFESVRDLDVVIPVKNEEHATSIASREPAHGRFDVPIGPNWSAALGHSYSSIRWRHRTGMIVCPFFVYATLSPPVVETRPTGRRASGRVRVTEAVHGLFNTHCYVSSGVAPHLMIRSTLARGEVRSGLEIAINCPIHEIVAGDWAGSEVAVVNAPHLGFDRDLLEGE